MAENDGYDIFDALGDQPEAAPQPEPVPEPQSAEPVAEQPTEPEPVAEQLPEPEPEAVAPELTDRERMLIERLEALTGEKLATQSVAAPGEAPEAAPAATIDFLAGTNIDEVLATPENFNRLLASVYQRGLTDSAKLSAESVLRNLPQVVSNYVHNYMTMREGVEAFYAANPELRSVKRTVASVANEIAAASPELAMDEVFAQAGERVYKMLNLKRQAPQAPPAQAPALVQPRGSNGQRTRVSAPALNGLTQEISELFNIR